MKQHPLEYIASETKRGHPCHDQRSPLAKARDAWLESDEGKRCRSGSAYGQYLQNRLELAFIAGANWAEETK